MKKTLLLTTLLLAAPTLWASEVVLEKNGVTLTDEEILTMTGDLSDKELVAMHQKPELLTSLIEQLFDNKVMAAALADELKQDPKFHIMKKINMDKFANSYYVRKKAMEKIKAVKDYKTLAKQTYQTDIEKYQSKPTADYYHIFWVKTNNAVDNRPNANQVFAKIKAGKITLAEAAKKYHNTVSGGNENGVLEKISDTSLMKPIRQAVADMKAGDMSEVIETDMGYHIIGLIKKNPIEVRPYDNELEKEIVTDIKTEIYSTTNAEIRKQYKGPEGLTVNEKLLQKINNQVLGGKQ